MSSLKKRYSDRRDVKISHAHVLAKFFNELEMLGVFLL